MGCLSAFIDPDAVPADRTGLYVVEVVTPRYDDRDAFCGEAPFAVATAATLAFARDLADSVPDEFLPDVGRVRIVLDGVEVPDAPKPRREDPAVASDIPF